MKKRIEKILKNKRFLLTILIGVLFIVSISFAMYNIVLEGQREHKISTNKLSFSYKEPLESLNLISYKPLSDEEGKIQDNYYEFTVSATSTDAEVIDYVIYLQNELTENSFSLSDIKVYLTKIIDNVETEAVNPTLISDLGMFNEAENTSALYGTNFTFTSTDLKDKSTTYRLRLWLKEGTEISSEIINTVVDGEQNVSTKIFEYKFKVNVSTGIIPGLSDENIPNAPELATNMIPVIYDSENSTWVKADSTNLNNSWYNYDDKIWANAVTVTSTNRQTYLDATAGTPISMDDINTMWVWIPRFNATIPELDCSIVTGATYETHPMCYNTTLTDDEKTALIDSFGIDETTIQSLLNGGTFEGLDLKNIIQIYNYEINPENPIEPGYEFDSTIQTTYQGAEIDFTTTSETSHDAFTFGEQNLSGFWMAKFEPSHPTLSDVSESNLLGCTNDTCENAKGIEILPNKASLRWNNVSNFFYAGRSMEQAGNNYGLVSNEIDTHMMKNNEWGAVAYLTYSEFGRCTDDLVCTDIGINNNGETENYSNITGYGAPAGSAMGVENGAYNTALGMDASTTGNIYGVYDMSGGAAEYVMGVYKPETLSGIKDYSGFSTSQGEGNSQYDKLTIGTQYYNVYTTSEAYDNAGLQHAVNETNGWYEDLVVFVVPDDPWFVRSSDFVSGGLAGVFAAFGVGGYDNDRNSFRPVLVK